MEFEGTYSFDFPLEDLYTFGTFQKPPILIEENCSKSKENPFPESLGCVMKNSKNSKGKIHIFILVHGLSGSHSDLNNYA